MSVEEVALGFIQVANETMCRSIRAITQVYKIRRNIFILVLIKYEIYIIN
jgi:N-methylhydantoinase A/oxoprolinase/acetone carboxylase beta subunit